MACTGDLVIHNVHLYAEDRDQARQLFTVRCRGGIIHRITHCLPGDEYDSDGATLLDGKGGILVPSLCHSHIHLDKCNLLPHCDELVSGTFEEAMEITSKAKASYQPDELLSRGRSLILESVKYGVTAMRAHAEVDATVRLKCVDAALQLKEELAHVCDVGVAVFAQDPLYPSADDTDTSENLSLLSQAAALPNISAIGSAPYVEPSPLHVLLNIDNILSLAISHNLHVDFHLDYTLSPYCEPLIFYVMERLREMEWTRYVPGKRVTIGHASRLSLFTPEMLQGLHRIIEGYGDVDPLPITFVSLPQTDLYILGRPEPAAPPAIRPRGTLFVPELVRAYGLDVAMSVNNVGNAFTPQGSLDPLSLCTFGVAVFQAGTGDDCRVLLESVSNTSKRAAGFENFSQSLLLRENDPADLLVVHANKTVQSLVLNPGYERTVVKGGVVVASKRCEEVVHVVRA